MERFARVDEGVEDCEAGIHECGNCLVEGEGSLRGRLGQVGLVRVVVRMVVKEDWRWERRICFQGQVGSGLLAARGQGNN